MGLLGPMRKGAHNTVTAPRGVQGLCLEMPRSPGQASVSVPPTRLHRPRLAQGDALQGPDGFTPPTWNPQGETSGSQSPEFSGALQGRMGGLVACPVGPGRPGVWLCVLGKSLL